MSIGAEQERMHQHLFFDLDNTLTRSRSPMEPRMRERLAAIPGDLVVISGASVEQIRSQVGDLPCYVLGQNGNHAVHGAVELWRDLLSEAEVAEIFSHITSLNRTWQVPDEHDLIENRGSQVSYSIYGHHAPVPVKEAFDADKAKRITLLRESPLTSDTIEVKIAGTTCLDYFKKGRNKGHNVARLIAHEGWQREECCYFGDMLFPGGNDESVLGVIETRAVKDPNDTYEQLAAFL